MKIIELNDVYILILNVLKSLQDDKQFLNRIIRNTEFIFSSSFRFTRTLLHGVSYIKPNFHIFLAPLNTTGARGSVAG
jgi:hypothetical protein